MQESFGLGGFKLTPEVYRGALKIASFVDRTTRNRFSDYSNKSLNSFLPYLEKTATGGRQFLAKRLLKYLDKKVLKAKSPKKARERVVKLIALGPKITALQKTLPIFKTDVRRAGRQSTEGMQSKSF